MKKWLRLNRFFKFTKALSMLVMGIAFILTLVAWLGVIEGSLVYSIVWIVSSAIMLISLYGEDWAMAEYERLDKIRRKR